MNRTKVLFADQEFNNLNGLVAYFRRNDKYKLVTAVSSDEVLKVLESSKINIAVIDDSILDEIGIQTFRKEHKPKLVLIVLTAKHQFDDIESSFKKGELFAYHCKPFNIEDLERSIVEATLIV